MADSADVWLVHHRATKALSRLKSAFSSPFLVVKGMASSATLYSGTDERPFADVDVRICPDSFESTLSVLRSLSGCEIGRVSKAYRSVVVTIDGQDIDIESSMGPPGVGKLTVERAFRRARACELAPGLVVQIPDSYDHALVFVMNLFKDKIRSAARWSMEDARRIVVQDTFDVKAFTNRARETSLALQTWVVAEWFRRVENDPVWERIAKSLWPPPRPLLAYHLAAHFSDPKRAASLDSLANRILTRGATDRAHSSLFPLYLAWKFENENRSTRRQ